MKKEKAMLAKRLNEIEAQERQDMIKKHFLKYQKMIGKCFRAENSYGGDSKKWWLYTKITEIKPDFLYSFRTGKEVTSYFNGWSFQVQSDGNINVEKLEQRNVHSIGIEIEEEEFNQAWKKLNQKLKSFH